MSKAAVLSARRPVKGFTIVELMVALMVLAVLAAVAVPSFRESRRATMMSTLSNDLVGALSHARAMAMSGSGTVTVASTDWSNGWTVTGAETREFDLKGLDDNDISLTGDVTTLTFSRSGHVLGGAEFVLCDSQSRHQTRTITVTPIGRISTSRSAAGCAGNGS